MKPRPFRVLFVANDGFSAGHVARTAAVASALARIAPDALGAEARIVVATTSRAHALLETTTSRAHALLDTTTSRASGLAAPFVTVTLPSPSVAQRAGFPDAERRRLVRGALEGVASAFGPDLLVADTFPSGPHGELAGLAPRVPRVLLRRTAPDAPLLLDGIEAYRRAIVADDPTPVPVTLPIPVVRVPPIVGSAPLSREAAREELGLRGRAVLVTWGGGGDEEARAIAERLGRLGDHVYVAMGPLAPPAGGPRVLTRAPLGPLLSAFDGAFAAAGYNTAHELAHAGVPTALFARPRPFDDQEARIDRFVAAGLATRLDDPERALAWMETATPPALVANGAELAARALLA